MVTKLQAARIATQGGADVVIASGRRPDVLVEVAAGVRHGTLLTAATDRLESRKRWILGNVSRGGHIIVDAGAAAALRGQGKSLLPAGVRAVEGAFDRGEAVEVRDPEGVRIAAGRVNYGSGELDRIRGLRSSRIVEVLGYAYGDEVIHRDNLVLL
jgi:glutamate 5-kinase